MLPRVCNQSDYLTLMGLFETVEMNDPTVAATGFHWLERYRAGLYTALVMNDWKMRWEK